MLQRIDRILFLLFVIAGCVRLSAQPVSELGVWVIDPKLHDSKLGNENLDKGGEFEEEIGYGLSFNRYWTSHFSTELSAQKYGADAILSSHSIEGEEIVRTGELDVTVIAAIAQWHFHRDGPLDPYVGAGISRISSSFEYTGDDVGTVDFKDKYPFIVAAGANIRLTGRIFLAGELKYAPYAAQFEGSGAGSGTDVNPLTIGAGLKARF